MPKKKLAKSAVDYGPGHLRGDHCRICRHFDPPQSCKIVEGVISALAWCNRFEKRDASKRWG